MENELGIQQELNDRQQHKTFKRAGTLLSHLQSTDEGVSQITSIIKDQGIEEFLFHRLEDNILRSSVIDSITSASPLLTVAYPSYSFFSDTESLSTHISNIDYTVLLDTNVSVTDSLEAYDSSGKLVKISAIFDTTTRYCVLKYNESLKAVNPATDKFLSGESIPTNLSTEFSPVNTISGWDLYKFTDVLTAMDKLAGVGPGGPGPVGPSVDTTVVSTRGICDECPDNAIERTCFDRRDMFYGYRFTGLDVVKQFETWWYLPKVEIVGTYVIWDNNSQNLRRYRRASTAHYMGSLGPNYVCNLDITNWEPEIHGKYWYVVWTETDNQWWPTGKLSVSVSFNVGIAEVGVKATNIEFGRGDDHIGDITLFYEDEYCDGEEYKVFDYNEGGFFITERMKH